MEKRTFLLTGFLYLLITTAMGFSPPYLLSPENNITKLSQNQTFSWVANDNLKSYELKIHECDYEKGNITKSINLGDYKLLREKEISAVRKVSGLTWAEGFSRPLIVCADEFQQVDAFGTSLTRLIINRLFGFSNFVKNYKGITHLYNDHYAMIDEATGKLMFIDYVPQTFANITYPLIDKFDLNININKANEGIEGIAYNQFNNSIYVAKEKSPMQLLEFKANFSSTPPNNLTQPFNLENAAKKWGIKNVSGLFHLSKASELNGTGASNNLLVLSSESNILIECDLNGNEISRLNLNANGANGLSKAIESAQGIAYGDGIVYILSSAIPEQNIPAKFYTFSNDNYKEANATIGNQVYSKSNISSSTHTANNLNIQNGKMYCWNIEGISLDNQKYSSNYFSFGEKTEVEPEPEIQELITLTSPFLNSTYRPGDEIEIKWIQNEDFKVNVYFYKDSSPVRTPAIGFDGRSVLFTVPSNSFTGDNYSIRVTSAKNETNYSSVRIKVDADFEPIGGEIPTGPTGDKAIAITSPSIGQSYTRFDNLPIRWAFNSSDKVTITLKSIDNLEIYELEKSYTNTGSFNYEVPAIPASNQYYIEIRSTVSNQIVSSSDKFRIGPKSGINNIKLGNGILGNTRKYLPGEKIVLTWNDQLPGDVIIQLFNKTGWVSGFSGVTQSDGYEQIKFKENLPADDKFDYRIRIISKDDKLVYAYSEPFKISAYDAFDFVVPASGTTYNSSGLFIVRWKTNLSNVSGLSRVKLTLMQYGRVVDEITSNTNNDGLYYWIPDVKDGGNYQLLLESTSNKGFSSLSPYFNFINGQAKLMHQPDFIVAPNPATDFVNISFKNILDGGNVNLQLHNGNGILLKEFWIKEDNMKLDVSDLPAGYYFINIKDEKQIINKKLLVE